MPNPVKRDALKRAPYVKRWAPQNFRMDVDNMYPHDYSCRMIEIRKTAVFA